MTGREPSWKRLEPAACRETDQAEFNAMRAISATLDTAFADDIISGEIDDEMDELQLDGPHWQAQDLVQENILDAVREEVNRRIKLLDNSYPFELRDNRLLYKGSQSGFYEYCLTLTQAQTITEGDLVKLPRFFERAVTGLMRAYFGPGARGLHTGFPRSPTSTFEQVMRSLEKPPFEWMWLPQEELIPEHLQDETLDFVVTLQPLDTRAGNLYVLGQCACGNNWPTKVTDPSTSKIRKWFNPPWIVPPIRAFTTPFVIGDHTMRAVANESQALVFDRPRLVRIAENMLSNRAMKIIKKHSEPLLTLV